MHLADRRGGHRLLLELEEEARDRLVQVLEDDALDVGVRERLDVVLEAAELGDDVGRDDVRARREELAELDERRPELVEHLPQVPPAKRRRLGRRRPPAFEHEAEAVAHRDLGDLAEAADARRLGRGHASVLHALAGVLPTSWPRASSGGRRPERRRRPG